MFGWDSCGAVQHFRTSCCCLPRNSRCDTDTTVALCLPRNSRCDTDTTVALCLPRNSRCDTDTTVALPVVRLHHVEMYEMLQGEEKRERH